MIIRKKEKIFTFIGKKGSMSHELFLNVFEWLLVGTILLALFFFIMDISNKTIFEKNYMARDSAILLNALYSAPGEVVYDYNENIQGLVFDFAGSKVEISSKDGKDSTKVFYLFGKNKNIQLLDKELVYDKEYVKIKFWKSKDSINIAKPDLSNADLASSTQTKTTG